MNTTPVIRLPKIPYRRPWLLWLCSVLFAVFYILFIIDEAFPVQPITIEYITVPLLFIYFLAAFILSWFRERTAGYMFIGWYLLVYFLGSLVWEEAGMAILLAFPLLPIGIFYVVYSYRKMPEERPEAHKQWKLALRLFVLAFLYIWIMMYSDEMIRHTGFLVISTNYLVLLGLLYVAAVVFTWIHPLFSGIMLLMHGTAVLILGQEMLAFPMFVIGLGYLILWITVRRRELLI